MRYPIIVVIGNGMVGYKFCEKLALRRRPFQIIVFGEDLRFSTAGWYRENHIRLHLEDPVSRIDRVNKTVFSLKGKAQKYDYLVISAGILPRDEIALQAGLETGGGGAICVDDNLQTSDPYIFAIGACALHRGMTYGVAAAGYEMADVVISNLCGEDKSFTGFDVSAKLKLTGVDVAGLYYSRPLEI
jgi:NAD(P)H-nitrite reductase large subunit